MSSEVGPSGTDTPRLGPFPPVPAKPEDDDVVDHKFAGRATPSVGPRMDVLIDSGRAPGGVGGDVEVGGGVSPEAGDVAGCVVCVCREAGVSAATYTPPNSVLPSGERDCRRSLTRSVPAP